MHAVTRPACKRPYLARTEVDGEFVRWRSLNGAGFVFHSVDKPPGKSSISIQLNNMSNSTAFRPRVDLRVSSSWFGFSWRSSVTECDKFVMFLSIQFMLFGPVRKRDACAASKTMWVTSSK